MLAFEERSPDCIFGRFCCYYFLKSDSFDIFLLFLLLLLLLRLPRFFRVVQLLLDHFILVHIALCSLFHGSKVDLRMVSLLHPAVALVAVHARLAPSFLDRFYLVREAPGLALLGKVLEVFGVPAVILNIVSVRTVSSIVPA